jgi:SAM-dependent methyltransferase
MELITNDYFRVGDPQIPRELLDVHDPWPQTWVGRLYEYRWALDQLDNFVRPAVLDVGCGQAAHCFKELALEKASRVVGVDPAGSRKGNDTRLLLILEDFFKSEIWTFSMFDAVYCISVLEHLDKMGRLRMLQKMRDCMKPDGGMFITFDVTTNPNSNGYHLPDFMADIHTADLKLVGTTVEQLGNDYFPLDTDRSVYHAALRKF